MTEKIESVETELRQGRSGHCCSKKGISIGTIAGIVLGMFIGMLFNKTLTGMIIGFSIGMGVGGVIDARSKR